MFPRGHTDELHRIRRRVERDGNCYTDIAPAPIDGEILPIRSKERADGAYLREVGGGESAYGAANQSIDCP